jgi:hypothetical protein|tara:strand:- start:239 stop:718 length:480 start_codon:yes stop_codon:yes gene_type:complete
MADKASSNLAASIFMDDIRSSISGSFNYEPKDANDKWVFAEVAVGNGASTDLLDTGDSYLGSSTQVATGDKVHWIAIKNTSSTATEGVAIDIITGTAAYDLKGINIIGAGEMIVLKPVNTTVADLHARSCTLDGTYGYATAQGSATVTVQVAAILDDVA